LDRAFPSLEHDLARSLCNAADLTVRDDLPAAFTNQLGIFLRDPRVVRDSRSRDVHSLDTGAVRLELAPSVRPDHREPGNAVRRSAAHEFGQSWTLGFVGGDNDLPADVVRNRVFVAKLHHPGRAGDTVPRFQ